MWLTLLLISLVFNSFATIFQRLLLSRTKIDEVGASIFFQIVTGILIGIVGFFFTDLTFPNLVPLLPNLLLMTVLYGFGSLFIFFSMRYIEASRFTLIFVLRVLFTIVASGIFLSEHLNLIQLTGGLLILCGVLVVTIKSNNQINLKIRKGELFALLAALAFGLAVTNDRFLIQHFNPYSYLALSFTVPGILQMLIFPKRVTQIKLLARNISALKYMSLLIIFYATQAVLFFTALKLTDNSSQFAVINQLGTVITVIVAIVFLRETDNIQRKIIALLISFLGLLLATL